MTSSDTADLKKIVKISITNIFISPPIIADDIIEFVLLANRSLYLYVSLAIFPELERSEVLAGGWLD